MKIRKKNVNTVPHGIFGRVWQNLEIIFLVLGYLGIVYPQWGHIAGGQKECKECQIMNKYENIHMTIVGWLWAEY